MILQGKTIMIMGVGTGLGHEIARLCIRDGANIVLGARTQAQLESVAKDVDPSGARVAFASTDVTNQRACQDLVELGAKRFGGIDAIVNVAAFEYVFGGLQDTNLDDWRKAFETNVLGGMTLLRAAAPALKKRGGGSVVLIGSQSMYLPLLPQAGYAASKGALLSAMYYLAKELGPDRIRVNMVVPSWMWGPPVQGFVKIESQQKGIPEEQVIAGITKNLPLGQITPDEDVAEAVVFFASDRARMITGQTLMVNAGELMR